VSDGRTGRTVSGGTVALLTVSGLVLGLILCCLGGWVFFGPVNYFGCGLSRPPGITAADLVGSYASPDGGRIELSAGDTFVATGIPSPDTNMAAPQLSGPGTWRIGPSESAHGDVSVVFTAPPGLGGAFRTSFDLAGSRTSPVLYWYRGDPDSCHIYRMNRA
jgi:hypothetical protein